MPPTTSKQKLTAFTLIYLPLAVVPLLFSAVVYYEVSSGIIEVRPLDDAFKYVMYASTPLGPIAAFILYKNLLSKLDTSLSLLAKFNWLQGVVLQRSALIEVTGLFAAVCAFISGQLQYLAITGFMSAILIFWRPTLESIKRDLQLSEAEGAKLSDPEATLQ